MARHNDLGKKGEEFALTYLLSINYNIIETNYRIGRAEFDIIARNTNGVLVFVEVKTRKSSFDLAEKAVNLRKQKILFEGAQAYKEKNELQEECFFEIISIQLITNQTPIIHHIKDAFYDFEY